MEPLSLGRLLRHAIGRKNVDVILRALGRVHPSPRRHGRRGNGKLTGFRLLGKTKKMKD